MELDMNIKSFNNYINHGYYLLICISLGDFVYTYIGNTPEELNKYKTSYEKYRILVKPKKTTA